MTKYPKIQTVFKRDMSNKGRIIEGEFALNEFEYLKDNKWLFTEKVDGTNIRIEWRRGCKLNIGGRTDNAQIPAFLYSKLQEILPVEKFESQIDKTDVLCLYGEGFGARIQKGGDKYCPDDVGFVLFDVLVDEWWLQREVVAEIALSLNIPIVPIRGSGKLLGGVELVRRGLLSTWGAFPAEGLVMRPLVELQRRNGERILAKIKHKDFL